MVKFSFLEGKNYEYTGILVDLAMIEGIHDCDRPKSQTLVRRVIALASYSRWFIEGFAINSNPMSRLIQKEFLF